MHKYDNWIGIGSGVTGGIIKYATIAEVQGSFSHKLLESVVIAVVCSLAGLLVKELYNWGKKKVFKK